jgi:DNA-directed RNA polymerase specialized sigma24 family protein
VLYKVVHLTKPNIYTMLLELSKRDSEWRKIALKICNNKQTADEIVQEMYMKIDGIKPKTINTSYVSFCMYHIFIDMTRKAKKDCQMSEITKSVIPSEGVDDEEHEVLNKFHKLPWYQRELIQESQWKSLRKMEREFNVNYMFIHLTLKKALKEIL